jgi:hypothetical protein
LRRNYPEIRGQVDKLYPTTGGYFQGMSSLFADILTEQVQTIWGLVKHKYARGFTSSFSF